MQDIREKHNASGSVDEYILQCLDMTLSIATRVVVRIVSATLSTVPVLGAQSRDWPTQDGNPERSMAKI